MRAASSSSLSSGTCRGKRWRTSTLQAALRAIGHGVPRDTVEADALWLAEQGLARRQRLDVGVTVLTVTPRGVEVAQGIAGHPGVDRPLPR